MSLLETIFAPTSREFSEQEALEFIREIEIRNDLRGNISNLKDISLQKPSLISRYALKQIFSVLSDNNIDKNIVSDALITIYRIVDDESNGAANSLNIIGQEHGIPSLILHIWDEDYNSIIIIRILKKLVSYQNQLIQGFFISESESLSQLLFFYENTTDELAKEELQDFFGIIVENSIDLQQIIANRILPIIMNMKEIHFFPILQKLLESNSITQSLFLGSDYLSKLEVLVLEENEDVFNLFTGFLSHSVSMFQNYLINSSTLTVLIKVSLKSNKWVSLLTSVVKNNLEIARIVLAIEDCFPGIVNGTSLLRFNVKQLFYEIACLIPKDLVIHLLAYIPQYHLLDNDSIDFLYSLFDRCFQANSESKGLVLSHETFIATFLKILYSKRASLTSICLMITLSWNCNQACYEFFNKSEETNGEYEILSFLLSLICSESIFRDLIYCFFAEILLFGDEFSSILLKYVTKESIITQVSDVVSRSHVYENSSVLKMIFQKLCPEIPQSGTHTVLNNSIEEDFGSIQEETGNKFEDCNELRNYYETKISQLENCFRIEMDKKNKEIIKIEEHLDINTQVSQRRINELLQQLAVKDEENRSLVALASSKTSSVIIDEVVDLKRSSYSMKRDIEMIRSSHKALFDQQIHEMFVQKEIFTNYINENRVLKFTLSQFEKKNHFLNSDNSILKTQVKELQQHKDALENEYKRMQYEILCLRNQLTECSSSPNQLFDCETIISLRDTVENIYNSSEVIIMNSNSNWHKSEVENKTNNNISDNISENRCIIEYEQIINEQKESIEFLTNTIKELSDENVLLKEQIIIDSKRKRDILQISSVYSDIALQDRQVLSMKKPKSFYIDLKRKSERSIFQSQVFQNDCTCYKNTCSSRINESICMVSLLTKLLKKMVQDFREHFEYSCDQYRESICTLYELIRKPGISLDNQSNFYFSAKTSEQISNSKICVLECQIDVLQAEIRRYKRKYQKMKENIHK